MREREKKKKPLTERKNLTDKERKKKILLTKRGKENPTDKERENKKLLTKREKTH